ncbi:MAG: tetratricopeptide repeat protein [Bryobacteraceae bacterium]
MSGRVTSLLCLLICETLLWAQNPAMEQAWSLAAKGQRTEAAGVLRKILQRKPRNAEAHLFLGSLLAEEGVREEAIAQLTEAVRLRPKSSEAQNALGEAYNRFDDPKAARECFEKAVVLNPKFGIAQSNLGAALLQAGESSAAASHLDQAIALLGRSPDAADAQYLRAKVYSAEGNYPKAAACLEQAVALRSDFAEAWSDLGMARKATSNDAGALLAFQRAVELNPKDGVAQYRLGAEYLRQDQPQLAVAPLQAAYAINPEDQSVLNSLQGALRQTGHSEEAADMKRKLTETLRKRDLQSQNAIKAFKLNNEGAALEKAGNLPEALERYRQASALNPAHAGIRTNYAIALLRLGRWAEGLTELHNALERDPNNPQLRAAWQDALSQAPPNLIPAWAKLLEPHR